MFESYINSSEVVYADNSMVTTPKKDQEGFLKEILIKFLIKVLNILKN